MVAYYAAVFCFALESLEGQGLMVALLFCLLGCTALSDLELLREGSQVQLTSADLSVVFATATVHNGELDLSAELEPLSNIVLLISTPPPSRVSVQDMSRQSTDQVAKLDGFVSPSAHDIMVQEPQETISLKDWLETRDIVLDVDP